MKERNYGIDLLRIVTMYFVVIIHTINFGMDLNNISTINLNYSVLIFIESFIYCAVNCYALISGFVGYKANYDRTNIKSYLKLWMQVEFYSVGITFLFFILEIGNVSIKDVIKSAFPVSTAEWWYFSSYTALYFLIPFLNKLVDKLEKRGIINFLLLIIVLYISNTIGYILKNVDPFQLSKGYSFIWLAFLYVIGALIKKFKLENLISSKKCFFIIMINTVITAFSKVISVYITQKYFGVAKCTEILYSYISPTVLCIAILMFFYFLNLNINEKYVKIIKYISEASFGVYVIHMQPIVLECFIKNKYVYVFKMKLYQCVFLTIFYSIIIFTICIFIDRIRIRLFKIMGVDKLIEKLNNNICTIYKEIENKIYKIII